MKLTDAIARDLTLPAGVQDSKTFFDDDAAGSGCAFATAARACGSCSTMPRVAPPSV